MAQKNGTHSKEEKIVPMKASNPIFQRKAEEDIGAIATYIAGDSPEAAERFFAAVDNLCKLVNTPCAERRALMPFVR